MVSCKPRLIPILALLLAASVVLPTPLLGQEEPFLGLWGWSPRGGQEDGLFLYRAVLRYRARAVLRTAGLLPEPFRATEDSLGFLSDRFEDFVVLQDSVALGWLPPSTLPRKGRDFTDRQISVDLDSALVEVAVEYSATPVHPTVRLTIEQYLDRMTRRNVRRLWAREAERAIQTIDARRQTKGGLLPSLALPVEMPGAIRSIVGSGKPNLQVNGSERISFSGTSRWYPDRPVTEFQRQQSKFPQLDMKQELNLKLTGNIGDKVSVDVDQSSQAATPLANRIRIHYQGYEDEIVQRVELGNTSLSLPGTQYVSYSGRHEGLFGIHAEARVGDLEVQGILSKQEGKNETRSITRGAELQDKTIEDWQFRSGKFFFLIHPDGMPLYDLDPTSVEVWIDDRYGANNNEQLTVPAYVTLSGDPSLPEPDSLRATGDFNQLVINEDFIVQEDVYVGYPVLILSDRQVLDGQMTKAMGVRYRTLNGAGDVGGFRGGDPDSLVLKLIRPAKEMGGTNPLDLTQGVFSATRKLELRNIYDLGSNLSQEGLVVKVRRKGTLGGSTDPDRIEDHTFLEILGLDLYTSAGEGAEETPGPDDRIDAGRIDYETGYVIFRELQPFAPDSIDIARRFIEERPDTLTGDLAVPEIYLRNDWANGDDPDLVSRYEFVVTARSVASRITLGFNLLQGSETVTSGGRALIRDRDYTIDYDTGEIIILDAADVRDTDEIKVSYSYLPFGGGGQKTLIGSALRYQPPGRKGGLSTTWVYESKGSPGIEGRRPRLGQEPTRTVVGELAGSYKTDSWLLTSLVDELPGVSTRQKSNLTIDAGMGLSFPNPNTRGKLYIDDFEGAKDEFLVSMNRLSWRPSGVPQPAPGMSAAPVVESRGECWWYSPRAAVKEGDLQPTAESSGGLADTEKDNNRQILELHFFPNGTTEEEKRESWFSLVQPLSTRGTDLSRAQFLDLWINDYIPLDHLEEREGKVHLEIGVVSENAIWKRVRPEELGPDSFDPPDFQLNTEDENRDGQLDDPGGGAGEDVGMDALSDAEEGTGDDPAYDNWEFVESNEDDDRLDPWDDPTRTARYARINGTQGNGRLDTEDLNGNLILDESEGYFHFEVDLGDTSLVEFESSEAPDQDGKYAPYTRGWRRYRITLSSSDSAKVGLPSWDQVRHLRIWVEGFSKETYLQIGGIEITGNRWYRGTLRDTLGVEIPDSALVASEEDFFPAVLNNKDNSTAEYIPPFKPRERQNVEEQEQSLTLEMRHFEPGHVGTVFRTYTQGQDFANLYRTLEFYLNQRIREGPMPNLEFFVRFARDAVTDEENYYEYRVPVTQGWDLKRVDLGELSRLQLADTCAVDTCLVVQDLGGGARISRKGNPNLTSVRRIAFGVVNLGPDEVEAGNVWIDELRLTGVRRDTGVASRLTVGLTLADLASVNVSYRRTDADFLRIGSDRGSGRTRTSLSVSSRMNLEKFFERTGLRVPLSYSISSSRDVPKFQPGSDLVLETATDEDITETSQQDLTFSASRGRSQNPLLRYTLDGFSLSGRMGRNVSNTPLSRISTASRSGNIQYNLPLGGGPPLRIYRQTELRLLPSSITLGANGSYTKTTEFGRRDGDLDKEFVRIPRDATRSGTLNWSTSMRPIGSVTYSFDQGRDLRLAVAPRKFLGVNVGTETSRRHKLTASHQVALFPKSLNVIPKVSWSSSFDGSFNAIQTGGAGTRERTNRLSNSSTVSFSGGIPINRLAKLLNPFGRGEKEEPAPSDTTRTSEPSRQRTRGRSSSRRGGIVSIGAVTATYTIGKTNRVERVTGEPSLGYQLGWTRDPGPDVRRPKGSSASSGDRRDMNITTDIKLLREVSIRTSFVTGRNKSSVNGGVTENRTRRFPDLSINWGRLHKKLGLGRIARELRASSSYSRSRSEQVSGGTSGNRRRDVRIAMNPLLSLDAKLTNGISTKLTSRYDRSHSEQESGTFTSVSKTRRRKVSLTLSKSLNLTRMVTNPITKKKSRVTSKLNLSLSANYGDEKRETSQGGISVVGFDHVRFDLSTTAGYNFTSSITGNAAVSFSQDTDRKSRTNTVRSVSVTVSASFRF